MPGENQAVSAVEPVFDSIINNLGVDKIKTTLPILREIRTTLS